MYNNKKLNISSRTIVFDFFQKFKFILLTSYVLSSFKDEKRNGFDTVSEARSGTHFDTDTTTFPFLN